LERRGKIVVEFPVTGCGLQVVKMKYYLIFIALYLFFFSLYITFFILYFAFFSLFIAFFSTFVAFFYIFVSFFSIYIDFFSISISFFFIYIAFFSVYIAFFSIYILFISIYITFFLVLIHFFINFGFGCLIVETKLNYKVMLILNVERMVKLRGIKRPFSLFIKEGFSNYMAQKLAKNEVRMITFENLERLCRLFKCKPNDLFEWRPNEGEGMNEHLPLTELRHVGEDLDLNALLADSSSEEIMRFAREFAKSKEKG
jgi:DNA-binding Xre family transcriptional regulator